MKYVLPAAIWSIAILLTSTDLFSAQHTASLFPTEVANFIARKLTHLTGYGIASALNFRALRRARGGWRVGWAAGAVGLALLVAAIDETHQAFVPSRGASAQDVVIDLIGAVAAQIIIRRRVLFSSST